ncbi:hypothetical protein KSE_59640 [Kitasatospora setae KM-6054]|uniref:Uncharacterized protein n=1 Tax=Kitasatospora setae (strain ATCC 33774 / DSM 43861 / JCM 3304 / KCC A-0304 / NBRC 14216 / KM-6054) TaxID=452652 RepID=E4N0Q0_KITSK|nr:hypothetical protein KSE_59640 [Kitasatospora setae KM-6054]
MRAHDPAALNDDVFVPAGVAAVAVPGSAVHDALRYALDDYATDARLTDALAALLIAIAAGGTPRQLRAAAAGEIALTVLLGTALTVLALALAATATVTRRTPRGR